MFPWAPISRRLRFLQALTQTQFAEYMHVDQATVSRWETGKQIPDIHHQRFIRDELHTLEPIIEPTAIESMPVLMFMYDIERIGLCIAASRPMAAIYHRQPKQMRYKMVRNEWSESVHNMWDTFMASDAWKSNNVAFGVATLLTPDLTWGKFTMMPVGSTPLLLATGVKVSPPDDLNPDEFKLTITTKDELINDDYPLFS